MPLTGALFFSLRTSSENFSSPNHFYVFVNLETTSGYPDFHIVPSLVVAKYVKDSHATWLKTPGKKGQAHRDSSMRQFWDLENEYLGKWSLLELD